MRIVFMGTPDFAVPSLRILIENGYTPVCIVTAPDRKSGRGLELKPSAVKSVAVEEGIPILQPESMKDSGFVADLEQFDVDLIVVVAFRILPESVYSIAKQGAFNLHGSLLPAYRGAAPIQRAIMAGEERTGVTTFFLKPKVDTGDLILQKEIFVGPDETGGEVHDRLAEIGAQAVLGTVQKVEAGQADSSPQNEALASPAPKIFKDDMRVDWSQSAKHVHNHIRALSPYPTAWTEHGSEQIKLYRSAVSSGDGMVGEPGEVVEAEERIVVACGSGAVELRELQRSGKRRMDAVDFLNGYTLKPGDKLG